MSTIPIKYLMSSLLMVRIVGCQGFTVE